MQVSDRLAIRLSTVTDHIQWPNTQSQYPNQELAWRPSPQKDRGRETLGASTARHYAGFLISPISHDHCWIKCFAIPRRSFSLLSLGYAYSTRSVKGQPRLAHGSYSQRSWNGRFAHSQADAAEYSILKIQENLSVALSKLDHFFVKDDGDITLFQASVGKLTTETTESPSSKSSACYCSQYNQTIKSTLTHDDILGFQTLHVGCTRMT